MNRSWLWLVLLPVLIVGTFAGLAQTADIEVVSPVGTLPELMDNNSWVQDFTGATVDDGDAFDMDARINQLRGETGATMFVVVENDLRGMDIGTYSYDLFNYWGIGDAERNDGMLLLLSPANGCVIIDVGSGIVDMMTNDVTGKILDDVTMPWLSADEYSFGLNQTVHALCNKYTELISLYR